MPGDGGPTGSIQYFVRVSALCRVLVFVVAFLTLHITALSAADNQWGPGYQITSNGLRIDGIRAVNPTNRVIWDDDMYRESKQICWPYVLAQAKLGRLDLRGAIMTYCAGHRIENGEKVPGQQTWQQQIDGYNLLRNYMLNSGLTTVPDTFIAGARQPLVRPASGNINDTKYTLSAGAQFIIQQADASTTNNPLVVFVGGQATTVATALLERPDIANRMIVFSLSSIPVGWNGQDEWASHIAAMRAPHVSFGRQTHSMGGYAEAWEDLPDNPLMDYLKARSASNVGYLHDGGPVAWYFNQHMVSGVQRRILVGDGRQVQDVTRSPYGHLYMPNESIDLKGLFGAMMVVLKDPRVWDPDYSPTSTPTESNTPGLVSESEK